MFADGSRLPEVEVAYETYGALNARADNALLVTHGITSTHHGADEPTLDRRRGWWHENIGPGKLFDTDRYFVVSSNILGSCYGSTGPASINPSTGRPYGGSFPAVQFEDIVNAQHMLLSSLSIDRLVAVAGSSIGGFQVFQWAVSFPSFMSGVIALDTGPWDTLNVGDSLQEITETLAEDPNWNEGDYYATGNVTETLMKLRISTLRSFGIEEKLAKTHSSEEIEAMIQHLAREWAEEFDAHSLIRLMQAWAAFDVRDRLDRIRAKVFYVLCDTDELFPSRVGQEVTETLRASGTELIYHEVKSRLGHYATTEEPEKWAPEAREFLARLAVY